MKLAPNSLVLEILHFDYGLTVSDPLSLKIVNFDIFFIPVSMVMFMLLRDKTQLR